MHIMGFNQQVPRIPSVRVSRRRAAVPIKLQFSPLLRGGLNYALTLQRPLFVEASIASK